MNRPPHTQPPSPSFHDGDQGYLPLNDQSYNSSNANSQVMTSDYSLYTNPVDEFVFTESLFTSSLSHEVPNSYSHEANTTAFTGLDSSRPISGYFPQQISNLYMPDAVPSNLPPTEPFSYPANHRSPFPLANPQLYPSHDVYSEVNRSGMVGSPVRWPLGSNDVSSSSSHVMGSMTQPGQPSNPYGFENTLNTEEWMPSMPPMGVRFTGANAGLTYDSEAEAAVGPSGANDEGSRSTSAQEKRPRIVTTREDGNYECTVEGCGKLFNRSYNYRAHMETHDSERIYPFICELPDCMKRFRRKTDLQRHHQSVHVKEKNHQCEYCGRFFSRKDTLGRHRDDGCSKQFNLSV